MVTKILLLIPNHDGSVDQNGVGAFFKTCLTGHTVSGRCVNYVGCCFLCC